MLNSLLHSLQQRTVKAELHSVCASGMFDGKRDNTTNKITYGCILFCNSVVDSHVLSLNEAFEELHNIWL